ncbi:MAG TPA: Pr6Pr family membrane protein [Oligoflexus sp.]|uniref:Pr6Pr family membrane protein n=1 Tax=Oligoflexus sp. TaxID=1971216 RepID=UPI002D8094EE|nr:Pr6Pr family membrane protein [Oligoflexus sp.]HET9235828.1 Pr6Pr family membrane protein [Oligoflexus sp.]
MNILRALRLALSVLIFTAVGIMLSHLLETRADFSAFNFFSYFTNQSNLLVAVFFIVDAVLRWRGRPLSRSVYDRTRGALILYMSMTTSIYWLFLHHLIHFSSPAASVANIFLHSGAFSFLVIDWLWDRPETRMCKRFFVIWLLYPLAYIFVIMGLGALRSWYPYPFLNIAQLGLQKWAVWNGIMALGIGSFAVIIIMLNNRLRIPSAYSSLPGDRTAPR